MDRRKKRFVSIVVLIITINLLVIVNLGNTFSYFVGPNGEIITSSLSGVTKLEGNLTINNIPVTNIDDNSNAILVVSGSSNMINSSVEKSGDGNSESNLGSNAAVSVQDDANFDVNGGTITTNGDYSDALFAYGSGKLSVAGSTVITKGIYSNGLMVADGGTIIGNYLDVTTSGKNSPAICSHGNGTVIVNGGTYRTSGVDSPVVFSEADVTVRNRANLVSGASEGIVIQGNHSVTLENSSLTSTDSTLMSVNDHFKNIFMYHSDNKAGSETKFTASNNTIVTNKGDTFYITNSNAVIKLTNNVITNHDGDFLRVEASSFGVQGSNGGDVDLTMSKQNVDGNITLDDISKLNMNLLDGSIYQGTINGNDRANLVRISLSSDSKISLTGDSYVDSLENENATNSNIDLNGYHLYVDGEELVINTHSSNGGNGTNTGTDTNNQNGSGGDSSDNSSSNNNNNNNSSTTSNDGQSNATSGGSSSNNGKNNNVSSSNNSYGSVTGGGSSSSQGKDTKNNSSGGKGASDQSSSGNKNSDQEKSGNVKSTDQSTSLTQGDDKDTLDVNTDKDDYQDKLNTSYSNNTISNKSLIIINVIGVLLIVTSIISLIKNKTLKDTDNDLGDKND